MATIREGDGIYILPDGSSIAKDADGEAGQRLAEVLRRIAEGIDTLVPFVPDPPPTAQERRAQKYAVVLGPLAIDYIGLLADNADAAAITAKLVEIKAAKKKIDDAIPLEVVEG